MPADGSLLVPQTLRVELASGYVEEMLLEEYVKGVVPTYLAIPAPAEALKALSIAVRSDAVASRRHSRDGFDLCNGLHCLIWKASNRYPDADQAVDDTAGRVIATDGRIVAAPFFEHCDGHTRNSEEVWSTPLGHCRSVTCACGGTRLHGHGVGLCQRGAVAMAQQGAAAQEILGYYYRQVEIVAASAVPRDQMHQSLIVGRAIDVAGEAQPGLRLALSGGGLTLHGSTGADGRFWFSHLPAGTWELVVKGKGISRGDLRTDGRNTVELPVVVPGSARLAVQVVPMAHPRRLIGTLGHTGVPVTLVDSEGQQQTVVSGSAPDFDPGGFVFPLPPAGLYTLRVLEQSLSLEVGQTGLWVRFSAQ